jgi:hypothetical protein
MSQSKHVNDTRKYRQLALMAINVNEHGDGDKDCEVMTMM